MAFGRRLKLEFHGATVTSDVGLLAFRDLDDALGLTAMAAEVLADPRTGRHSLIAQLRQSVFGRLAGYEDVNDADRLGRDPARRWIVGGRAVTEQAASTSQMGRFETSAMTSPTNLTALADFSGHWIDRARTRCARTTLVLDIDSSLSPTYGHEGRIQVRRRGCAPFIWQMSTHSSVDGGRHAVGGFPRLGRFDEMTASRAWCVPCTPPAS